MAIKGETSTILLARYRARRQYGNWRKQKAGRLKIATLFAEAKGKCKLCGRNMILRFDGNNDSHDMATLDHVIPLSVTAKFDPNAEYQVVCQRCNVRKANRVDRSDDEMTDDEILEEKAAIFLK